jgi:transposase
MYFKTYTRINPDTGQYSGYHRLVESYRDVRGFIRHRTMATGGFMDDTTPGQRTLIQKILTERAANPGPGLFDSATGDATVDGYVSKLLAELVERQRIDAGRARRSKHPDVETIFTRSIKHEDVREVGAEWLCAQALDQLGLGAFLGTTGMPAAQVRLALTHIISRAVHPASELGTARWIRENSAVCELTGTSPGEVTKNSLYEVSRKLFEAKDLIEGYLSTRTSKLFDIEDKIMLFDLTNTYFEGRMTRSEIAMFGRSKEKRSDARLVVMAMVVNTEGFIKYSAIHEGNMADCKSLAGMIDKLRSATSSSAEKAIVVIDAGIATDENLALISGRGYDYICVSRAALTRYGVEEGAGITTVTDNKGQKIELQRVASPSNTDYYLKVDSHAKALKEKSMQDNCEAKLLEELEKVSASLGKKGGVKQEDKVYLRLGRLQQRFPTAYRRYTIEVHASSGAAGDVGKGEEKKKKKDTAGDKRIVTSVVWTRKAERGQGEGHGTYFVRSSITGLPEEKLWQFYNTIREIESTFRCLKTDLDLRPVFHKTDENIMAHLHLGLLAYWVVNTVRHQLKKGGINSEWREIVRVMNTHKAVTTSMVNTRGEQVTIRKCSEPTEGARLIYDTLTYKRTPFPSRKSVVLKHPPRKKQGNDREGYKSG